MFNCFLVPPGEDQSPKRVGGNQVNIAGLQRECSGTEDAAELTEFCSLGCIFHWSSAGK